MSDPLAPVIEGFDCSGLTDPYSFRCEPFYVDGDNGGTLLDGSTVHDILATRVRLSWALNVASPERYAEFFAVLNRAFAENAASGKSPDVVSAYYFDPTINAGRVANFHISRPALRTIRNFGQYFAIPQSELALEESSAVSEIASGDWWALYSNGTLAVYCVGNIPDYAYNTAPWYDNRQSVTNIQISDSVTGIGDFAFYGANVKNIAIPDSVTYIGKSAFRYCDALETVAMGNGVVSVKSAYNPDANPAIDYGYTFADCPKLSSVTLSNRLTNIAKDMFWKCASLTSVEIPDSVTSIGAFAFHECTALQSVAIPDGVISVEKGVFSTCTALTSVTIPDSVTTIANTAFYRCESLSDVYYAGTEEQWEAISIDADGNAPLMSAIIHYGGSGTASIASGDGWTLYDNGTLNIRYDGDMPSYGSSDGAPWHDWTADISRVTVRDSVTSIGGYAFYGCANLASVTIPDSVESIGISAFSGCQSLTELSIPESVAFIDSMAFNGCSQLESVAIPQGVSAIKLMTFSGCSALAAVAIPDSVLSVGNNAFDQCVALTDVYYGGTEAQWSEITVGSNNSPLTSATIHYNSSGA